MAVTSIPRAGAPNWYCARCRAEFHDPDSNRPCPYCRQSDELEDIAPAVREAQAVMQPPQAAPTKSATKSATKGSSHTAPNEARMAHIVAMLLWCGAWTLNGVATILPIALLGRSVGQLGLFIGLGVAVHAMVTLIENHLWRSFSRCYPGEKMLIGLEIFAVGLVDVMSAALMFLFAARWLGIASYSTPWYTICTLIAVAVAIGSEPMIRFHRKLLRR